MKVLYQITCLLSSRPAWPTCPGAQEKNENGLFSEVLNGQVSLFSSHGAIHTLIAVALTNRKQGDLNSFSRILGNKNKLVILKADIGDALFTKALLLRIPIGEKCKLRGTTLSFYKGTHCDTRIVSKRS